MQQALSQYENALKMGETVYIDSTLLWDIALEHFEYIWSINNPYDSYFCMCRVVESGDRDAIDVLVYNIEPVPLGADPGKYYINLKYLLDKYGYSVDYYEDENENEET